MALFLNSKSEKNKSLDTPICMDYIALQHLLQCNKPIVNLVTFEEMNMTNYSETWAMMGQNALDSIKTLGEINTQAIKELSGCQTKFFELYLEAGRKNTGLVAETKNYVELVNNQAELARDMGEELNGVIHGAYEISTAYQTDLTKWVEQGLEGLKKAA